MSWRPVTFSAKELEKKKKGFSFRKREIVNENNNIILTPSSSSFNTNNNKKRVFYSLLIYFKLPFCVVWNFCLGSVCSKYEASNIKHVSFLLEELSSSRFISEYGLGLGGSVFDLLSDCGRLIVGLCSAHGRLIVGLCSAHGRLIVALCSAHGRLNFGLWSAHGRLCPWVFQKHEDKFQQVPFLSYERIKLEYKI